MSTYKPPYYVTLGFYVMVKTPDGQIVGVPMAVEEVGEDGIGAVIEAAVSGLAAAGLPSLTPEEYDAFARGLAAREQSRQLAEAIHERTKDRAIDPEQIDKILALHRGRPGGDA